MKLKKEIGFDLLAAAVVGEGGTIAKGRDGEDLRVDGITDDGEVGGGERRRGVSPLRSEERGATRGLGHPEEAIVFVFELHDLNPAGLRRIPHEIHSISSAEAPFVERVRPVRFARLRVWIYHIFWWSC